MCRKILIFKRTRPTQLNKKSIDYLIERKIMKEDEEFILEVPEYFAMRNRLANRLPNPEVIKIMPEMRL